MKFAKKFFVGILAVAMLVSCLALSVSAEDDVAKLPSENLEDVLEYVLYDEAFAVQNYDDAETDSGVPAEENFVFSNGDIAKIVVDSDTDKSLLITNNSTKGTGYFMDLTAPGKEFKDLYVTSFDFKTGDADGTNGSDFYVVATLNDYHMGNIVLFAAKTADDSNMTFCHSEYDSDRVVYNTVTADGVTPELGAWYHVEIVFSVAQSKYSVTLKKDNAVVYTFVDEIADGEGISSMRYYVSDPADAGETKTWIDDFAAYEGAAVRDVAKAPEASAEFVAAIHALSNNPETSIEKQLEIAELYKLLFGQYNYTPDVGVKFEAQAKAAADGYQGYINRTYARAFIYYTNEAFAVEGYYNQIDYYDEYVLTYYNMFKNGSYNAETEGLDTEIYANVEKAISDCEKLQKNISLTKNYCDNFVKAIEEGYDPANKDYVEMLAKYGTLSVLKSRVEGTPEYDYSAVNPATKYPTVADAIAAYDELEAKIKQIIHNADEVFIPAVNAMDLTQFDSVSPEAPYLTKDFENLYDNYLAALTVYSNGTVHEGLDPATYPGLASAIARFEECAAYVEARVADCLEFVSRVNGAYSSTYYITVLKQLEFVKDYFDDNKEHSLEKYEGVEEAIALYNTLLARVEKNEVDAKAYIAAVEKIDLDASYLQLKAAVDEALKLKADGDVTGYTGIEDANIKFAKAEAIVSSLAGHSSTLIEAVEALKTAKTLSERRYFIFVANGAKDSAEEKIDGVTEAKAALEAEIQKYNSEIAAMNGLFDSVVGDVTCTMTSVTSGNTAANVFAVVGALVK